MWTPRWTPLEWKGSTERDSLDHGPPGSSKAVLVSVVHGPPLWTPRWTPLEWKGSTERDSVDHGPPGSSEAVLASVVHGPPSPVDPSVDPLLEWGVGAGRGPLDET